MENGHNANSRSPLKHVYRRISSDMLLFLSLLIPVRFIKEKERSRNAEEVGNCFARMPVELWKWI